jgi:hypothetical protein
MMRLCYVEEGWAYFTDQLLNGPTRQWGDDWDDAPYEHNAGRPYTHDGQDILVLGYRADMDLPGSNYPNSSYSVARINEGVVPWLCSPTWRKGPAVTIFAGAGITEFIEKIRQVGGKVFREVT